MCFYLVIGKEDGKLVVFIFELILGLVFIN